MIYPMTHDDLKVERELRYAHLERRRSVHDGSHHAEQRKVEVAPAHRQPIFQSHRLGRAVATAALLLGVLAGAAVAF